MDYSNKDPLLLRAILMNHYENPTNFLKHETEINANYCSLNKKSSTCMDNITTHILIQNKTIIDAKFSGLGCAISTSATDIICDLITNKSIQEALEIIDEYLKMVSGVQYDEEILNEAIALMNIANQPNRLKCAQIGVNAIREILLKNN